jgi:hypothetical protein
MTNFVLIPTIDSTGKTQYLRAAQANDGSLSLSSTAADVSGDPIVVALDGTDATGVSPLGRLFFRIKPNGRFNRYAVDAT